VAGCQGDTPRFELKAHNYTRGVLGMQMGQEGAGFKQKKSIKLCQFHEN